VKERVEMHQELGNGKGIKAKREKQWQSEKRNEFKQGKPNF